MDPATNTTVYLTQRGKPKSPVFRQSRVLGPEFSVQRLESRVEGPGFGVESSVYGVQGVGSRVRGSHLGAPAISNVFHAPSLARKCSFSSTEMLPL